MFSYFLFLFTSFSSSDLQSNSFVPFLSWALTSFTYIIKWRILLMLEEFVCSKSWLSPYFKVLMNRRDEEQDPREPLSSVYLETRWRNQILVMRLHLCWMAGDTVLHKWSRKQEHKHWSVQTEWKIKSRTYLTIYAVKKKKKKIHTIHI